MATLKAENFTLELKIHNEGDSVSIRVIVSDNSFAGKTQIFSNKSDFTRFVLKLSELYSTLDEGIAEIVNGYEEEYVRFTSDGLGHFQINGVCIYANFSSNGFWRLDYSHSCDQTFLKEFIQELSNDI